MKIIITLCLIGVMLLLFQAYDAECERLKSENTMLCERLDRIEKNQLTTQEMIQGINRNLNHIGVLGK